MSILVRETIDLLEEVKSEYGDAESCALEALTKAIENLVEIEQEQVSDADSANKALEVLSKALRVLPEVLKLLESLGLF